MPLEEGYQVKSGQTRRSRLKGFALDSETVHSRNVRNRMRFFSRVLLVAFRGTMWSGTWQTWQRTGHHTNWLERRAVIVAIQLIQFLLRGKTTIFMLDNATMVFCLKTVFLLALARGKRRCKIHALSQDVRWINGDVRTVEIAPVPSFMRKTHVITNGLGGPETNYSELVRRG